jgi:hypothetical protein
MPFPTGITADAITSSHEHADHTAVHSAGGTSQIFHGLEEHRVGMVTLRGFAAKHGEYRGSLGPNTIYVFAIGDV